MRLGIVGVEAEKLDPEHALMARNLIQQLLTPDVTAVISGGCHLGGIDIIAAEEGKKLGLEVIEHLPQTQSWLEGYKPRNILIAIDSDKVVCITVKKLPEGYKGMRFGLCYHCKTTEHVKSGGCWTVKYALRVGKQGEVIVL